MPQGFCRWNSRNLLRNCKYNSQVQKQEGGSPASAFPWKVLISAIPTQQTKALEKSGFHPEPQNGPISACHQSLLSSSLVSRNLLCAVSLLRKPEVMDSLRRKLFSPLYRCGNQDTKRKQKSSWSYISNPSTNLVSIRNGHLWLPVCRWGISEH